VLIFSSMDLPHIYMTSENKRPPARLGGGQKAAWVVLPQSGAYSILPLI
jgi:hypothetical protein